jgi:hypothetical protein
MSGTGTGSFPSGYYRMGELYYNCPSLSRYVEIEKINQNEIHHIQNSPLTNPNSEMPVYVQTSGTAIQTYPTITSGVVCNYISRPSSVNWSATVVLGESLYNANASTNFQLHDSEESELVIKVLELAGITIKDPQLYPIAAQEEAQNVQQEK